jgi:hypothetical protein
VRMRMPFHRADKAFGGGAASKMFHVKHFRRLFAGKNYSRKKSNISPLRIGTEFAAMESLPGQAGGASGRGRKGVR